MWSKEALKLKKLLQQLKTLKRVPKEADDAYFSSLQDKIMEKITPTTIECEEVQENLVDLIESNIDKEKMELINKHLENCANCSKDLLLTKSILDNEEHIKATAPNNPYFEALPGKIEQRLFEEGVQTPCERTRLYIADKIFDEALPEDIQNHLSECEECAREVVTVEKMLSSLKMLYIPTPSQKYFEEMLENIDRKIEVLPSHRIVPEYQKISLKYLTDIFETFKTAIMHPYVAVALSATVTLVVVGGRFFSSPESIEEKQINLSDVISSTRPLNSDIDQTGSSINVYSTAYKDNISHPVEDEKLQINTTGTAKKEDKNKKLN